MILTMSKQLANTVRLTLWPHGLATHNSHCELWMLWCHDIITSSYWSIGSMYWVMPYSIFCFILGIIFCNCIRIIWYCGERSVCHGTGCVSVAVERWRWVRRAVWATSGSLGHASAVWHSVFSHVLGSLSTRGLACPNFGGLWVVGLTECLCSECSVWLRVPTDRQFNLWKSFSPGFCASKMVWKFSLYWLPNKPNSVHSVHPLLCCLSSVIPQQLSYCVMSLGCFKVPWRMSLNWAK